MRRIRVAINGFGRIGKCVFRALVESGREDVEIVAINLGMGDIDSHLHLLKYDSTHGIFNNFHKVGEKAINANQGDIALLLELDPQKLAWDKYDVDIVMECSGAFTTKASASKHLSAGAKKVMVSAPCEGADKTIVYGVNEQVLNKDDKVISIGSCTTNCLAPIAKVINDKIGIESGFMTTIHSYTNDQNVLDGIHKDKRRARACALSMIPSSTGAAKALSLVLPELEGKLDGVAIRVPTHNVSFIDLTFVSNVETSVNEINELIIEATKGDIGKVLGFTAEELVSIDFNHNSKSSTFDLTQTKVVKGKFCRVAAWYDNEWGFSNRMLDVAALYGNL